MSGNPNCSNRNPGILMCACERGAGRKRGTQTETRNTPLLQTVLHCSNCAPRGPLSSRQIFPVDYVRTG